MFDFFGVIIPFLLITTLVGTLMPLGLDVQIK
jgi:hypothetical protein